MPWIKPGGRLFAVLVFLHLLVGALGVYYFRNILLGVFFSGLVLTSYLWGYAAIGFVKNPRRELWDSFFFGVISILPFSATLLILMFPDKPFVHAAISLIAAGIGLLWVRRFNKK